MTYRLVQFVDTAGNRRVGTPSQEGSRLHVLQDVASVYSLAERAIAQKCALADLARACVSEETANYDEIIGEKRLLLPFDHADPCRMIVTGTGLTHLGSAGTRDSMHQNFENTDTAKLTDSMRMFQDGLKNGKPVHGGIGSQPEWFYKGSGHFLVPPEDDLPMPAFAIDGGEEPELTGLYLVGSGGQPYRVGFAIGNEFSDHVTERQNYLLLAHSKLRSSSFGPEIVVEGISGDISGMSRIRRNGSVLWEKPFVTGEANMSHTIANLEHHHFKYAGHRVPGDVHIHYFGTATLSFADGIRTAGGDVFEIEASGFGRPLRNRLAQASDAGMARVVAL